MRAIDNYTDKEHEVLALKGMLQTRRGETAPRTASERAARDRYGEGPQSKEFNPFGFFVEPEPEEPNDSNETGDQQGETGNAIPPAVRVALLVVLNHVEPGWENCVTVLRLWLEGARL